MKRYNPAKIMIDCEVLSSFLISNLGAVHRGQSRRDICFMYLLVQGKHIWKQHFAFTHRAVVSLYV
jgi:hypothetical protein